MGIFVPHNLEKTSVKVRNDPKGMLDITKHVNKEKKNIKIDVFQKKSQLDPSSKGSIFFAIRDKKTRNLGNKADPTSPHKGSELLHTEGNTNNKNGLEAKISERDDDKIPPRGNFPSNASEGFQGMSSTRHLQTINLEENNKPERTNGRADDVNNKFANIIVSGKGGEIFQHSIDLAKTGNNIKIDIVMPKVKKSSEVNKSIKTEKEMNYRAYETKTKGDAASEEDNFKRVHFQNQLPNVKESFDKYTNT